MATAAPAQTGVMPPATATPDRAATQPAPGPRSPWPAGCEVLHVTVPQMTAYLDACLARGVDVEATADGWLLLRGGDRRVVLLVDGDLAALPAPGRAIPARP